MNIEEKLAESNELLMDTSLSGITVSVDGLIWKPQFAEYLCETYGPKRVQGNLQPSYLRSLVLVEVLGEKPQHCDKDCCG